MTLRVAVAGLAHFHVQYILDELELAPGELELVGMSDPDPANRAAWGAGRESVLFEDRQEMLERTRPDVVAVFEVYARRADAVVDALDVGAAVLVDKPLCTTDAELERIDAAVSRSGGIVSTIFEKRWYAETIAVRRLLHDGVIGRVRQFATTAPHKLNAGTRPEWFFDERYGSIVSDLLSHDLDLFLELTDARTGSLAAWDDRGVDPAHPAWASTCGLLVDGGGVGATMEANWLWPAASPFHGQYRMRLTGERGVIEVDWATHDVLLLTEDSPTRSVPLPPAARPAAQALLALCEGRTPEVDSARSLAVARLGLLAARSARDGSRLAWGLA